MKCPKCKTPDLKATRIEEGLPAAGCPSCSGALVSLLYYRDWAERHQSEPMDVAHAKVADDVQDTSVAIMCPKCARLMMKYKISGLVSNRLDVCISCDEAWLDGGEWALLKALELASKMPSIFTDAWQRNIRRQVAEGTRRSILTRLIGAPNVERVEEIRKWLDGKPFKKDVLAYLYRD
jgi:Zn-finger nucleic acid-binding protein